MDTLVLIPAYKPDMRLSALAEKLCGEYKVLIVDDGGGAAFDDVFASCESFATVLRYPVNKGKGGAMKHGFARVKELFHDVKYVVTADADGQHTPEDIGKVASELREKSGLVLGSRAFTGKVPFRSKSGNTITRWVFAVASGAKVYDTQTGLRGFSVDYLEEFVSLEGDRYEYEMTMLMYAAEKKIPIHEVEIETIYENDNESSHFNAVKDSFKIYSIIFKCSCILKYFASSVLAFLVNYVLFLLLLNLVFTGETTLFGEGLLHTLVTAGHRECALVLAWMVSSFTNFTLNRVWVFRSNVGIVKAAAEYYSLAVVSFLVKALLFELFVRLLSVPEWIAVPVSEAAMYIINYIVQKKFVFKKK